MSPFRWAERLVADIPCAEKIAYATTGSEATAYAMRLARAFTGREKILKFEGAYHGNHDYALVSAFPTAPGKMAARNRRHRRTARRRPRINADRALQRADAAEIIFGECGDELAAVIVEPVQRIIPADLEFLASLRALCDLRGVILIFDEVVTGFRIAYGGAHAELGITPDPRQFRQDYRRRRAVVGRGGTRRHFESRRPEAQRRKKLRLL